MAQVATTHADQQSLRTLRTVVALAIASLLVALAAGAILLIASPASGSTAEATLGIAAAVSGLATAVFAIAAAIYAQLKNLWRYAPMWVRVAAWVLIAIGIVSTLWSWATQIA